MLIFQKKNPELPPNGATREFLFEKFDCPPKPHPGYGPSNFKPFSIFFYEKISLFSYWSTHLRCWIVAEMF